MRWPWQRVAPVEYRSSYSDQVVTAILASAARRRRAASARDRGARNRSADVRGRAGELRDHRAIGRDARARCELARDVAAALIRHGECVYVVGADPVDGLELRRRQVSMCTAAPIRPTPTESSARGQVLPDGRRTAAARFFTSDGSLTTRGRGAASVRCNMPATRARLRDGSKSRLGEEASGPVGSFLPVAKFEPDDGDLGGDGDPLAALRRDIGAARGALLTVESMMAQADSPASAPRRDYQVARFGANPPQGLIELRDRIAGDVAAACGIPRGLVVSTGSAQAARESWRQWIAGGVDGLARRIEAQIRDQVGVSVQIDTSPLGGRDLAGRAGALAKIVKAGVPIADARAAAGI